MRNRVKHSPSKKKCFYSFRLIMNNKRFFLLFGLFVGILFHPAYGNKVGYCLRQHLLESSTKQYTLLTYYYFKRPVPVKIQYADSSKASILVLPGWNLKATEWCEKTTLCKKAKEQGFDLVFVECNATLLEIQLFEKNWLQSINYWKHYAFLCSVSSYGAQTLECWKIV